MQQIILRFHEKKFAGTSDTLREIEQLARAHGAHVMPIYPPSSPRIELGRHQNCSVEAVLIIANITIATFTPLICRWLKLKSSQAVHIKKGDIEVSLQGSSDVGTALATLKEIEDSSDGSAPTADE